MELLSYLAEAVVVAFLLGAVVGSVVAVHMSTRKEASLEMQKRQRVTKRA